jgi:large subunit ribosomal protein L10
MNRTEKAAVVEEVAGQLSEADAIFAVDYRGITVKQVAELRGKLRNADTKLRVVKNSLGELAADKAGQPELKPFLQGPTALALVRGDVAVAAKALNDTQRQLHGILEFKGGTMNGAALTPAQIVSIARLPSREVLQAQLVGTIAAPLTGLVRGLNALIQGLAIQLQAIADQGLVSGTAPAPPAPPAPPAQEAPEPEAEVAPEPEAAPEPEPEPDPEPEPEAAVEAPDEQASGGEAAVEAEPLSESEGEAQPQSENETSDGSAEPEE